MKKKVVSVVMVVALVLAMNCNVYASDDLAYWQAQAQAAAVKAQESQAAAVAAQAAYEAIVSGKSVPATSTASTVTSTAASAYAKATANTSNANMITVDGNGDPVIGLWVADIVKNIPKPLLNTFKSHNGHIHIVSAEHQYGGMTKLMYDTNDHIGMANPINMYINSDYINGMTPDYLYHEFGHVFDAATGLSNDVNNRAVIESEMPALQATVGGMYTTYPFGTVQEATAEVYMATIGAKTGEITYAPSILAACPKTTALITQYSAKLK